MTLGPKLPLAASVVNEVQRSVDSVVLGQLDAACRFLEHLDTDKITAFRNSRIAAASRATRAPRDVPGELRTRRTLAGEKSQIFERDHWTCRLCGAQTIDLQVLRCLSRLFPETLPFHRNWKFTESHLIYWTLSTSLEHVVPFARGGADEPSNFVTSCYACNDARGDLLLDEIGWSPQPIAETDWRGLTENRLKPLALVGWRPVDRAVRTARTRRRAARIVGGAWKEAAQQVRAGTCRRQARPR